MTDIIDHFDAIDAAGHHGEQECSWCGDWLDCDGHCEHCSRPQPTWPIHVIRTVCDGREYEWVPEDDRFYALHLIKAGDRFMCQDDAETELRRVQRFYETLANCSDDDFRSAAIYSSRIVCLG